MNFVSWPHTSSPRCHHDRLTRRLNHIASLACFTPEYVQVWRITLTCLLYIRWRSDALSCFCCLWKTYLKERNLLVVPADTCKERALLPLEKLMGTDGAWLPEHRRSHTRCYPFFVPWIFWTVIMKMEKLPLWQIKSSWMLQVTVLLSDLLRY